jgi:bifunctional non-homologous end joining protein LigD
MDDLFSILTSAERDKLEKCSMPTTPAPMLATLTDKRFSDPGCIYERKLDGERAVAQRNGRQLRLLTRNGKDIASTYPELVDALGKEDRQEFAVDGEIVAFDGKVTSFARLQQRMQTSDPDAARASGIEISFYLFDITYLDGRKLDKLPLRSRKKLLKRAFSFAPPLRFLPHRNESGEAFFEAACKKGWEGIIAKRADAPYRHSRSRDWLKFKCAKGQELVIGGFSEPKGSRTGFGALLVGYYDDDGLRYAGKVGTGYDEETLTRLRRRMDRLARKTSPFVDDVPETDITWISPKLVGEFGFTEWTRSGKLRHPRFLGLRRDKAAKDVVRERPAN